MNANLLEILLEQYQLKDRPRTGWVLRGVDRPESVAGHSWGTALLCLYYAGHCGAELERSLAVALVHDLAEAELGDIARRVDPRSQTVPEAEKARREAEIMTRYATRVPGVMELWKEYEHAASLEARFVRDMNLIDMCIQALLYERDRRYDEETTRVNFPDYPRLEEFFATAMPRLLTPCGKELYDLVYKEYRAICRGPKDPT